MKVFKSKKSLLLSAIICSIVLLLTSCVVYTEARSQALSRSVAATADSVKFARFDLAYKYSQQAERIAYAPKERIDIQPLITSNVTSIKIENTKTKIQVESPTSSNKTSGNISTSVVQVNTKQDGQETILRLVVPEHLKHARLLIENSEEWLELMKTKKFSDQIKKDNENLQNLIDEVTKELEKQKKIYDELLIKYQKMEKEIGEKNAAIWLRNFIILALTIAISAGVYLRIKGIL